MKNTEAILNLSTTSSFPNHQANDDHQSAQLIGHNNDLLTEILSRLPAKSILQFKSVSKPWLSLLTHPRFIALYDKRSISSGLYYHELYVPFDVEDPTPPPPFRSLDLCHNTRFMSIVQSCNGLLLFRCDKEYDCCGRYYVFNPTTKKFAVIPPIIGAPRYDSLIRLMGLAYHPTECVHYKLVCILRAGFTSHGEGYSDEGHRMYIIQIYSSETGKWKKLKQTFTPDGWTVFKYGVYWNGAFHWAPSCPNPMYLRLDNEEIHDLPLPSPLPVRVSAYGYGYPVKMPLYFGESCGHLHLVDSADNKNHLIMNVYEMLSDHSGWFIKYELDLSELCVAYPNMVREEEEDKLDFSLLDDDGGEEEEEEDTLVRDDEDVEYKYDFSVLDVVRGGGKEEDTFIMVRALNNIKRYNILDQSFQQQLFTIPDNIDYEYHGNFPKTFQSFVGHRHIEKIGSF